MGETRYGSLRVRVGSGMVSLRTRAWSVGEVPEGIFHPRTIRAVDFHYALIHRSEND